MNMYNPAHPGEFIQETYLDECSITQSDLAKSLDVDKSTLSRLLAGQSRLTPDMAIRLSIVLGRSPESWLAMQSQYDLWKAKSSSEFAHLKALELCSA